MSDLDKLVEHIEVAQQALQWADKRIQELEALTKWRPIETAPKDGTTFVTYSPPFLEGGECTVDTAGWLIDKGEFWKGGCGWQWVTHWKPLDAPAD